MLSHIDTQRFSIPGIKGITTFVMLLGLLIATTWHNTYAYQDSDTSLTELAQDLIVDRSEEVMRVSMEIEDMPLSEALKALTEKVGVGLSYSSDISLDQEVSLQLNNVLIHEAIYLLLEGSNLEPALPPTKDVLVIREKEMDVEEIYQETIRGQVTDAQTGEAIPGVNIIVSGTTIGTSTDVDGYYELTVPNLQETLVFSYIGYERFEIQIDDRIELNVEMLSEAIRGEELVVVGYGTQEKVNLTGSVTSINVDRSLEGRAITDVSQILAGLSAGVQVRQTSGQPGADGTLIRIRGVGTLNDASPLIIIDGVEGSISDLNPNDVEEISILKDAASASIYGSRAANGVVLVTTKTGREGPPVLRYDGFASVQSPMKLMNTVSNYTEHMRLMNEGYNNSGLPDVFDFNNPVIANWEENSRTDWRYANTDWYDAVLQPDWSFNHNLSISGGGSETTYLASVGYLDNRGIIENAGMERYSGRLNIQTQALEWLSFGINAQGLWSNQDLTNVSSVFTFLNATSPGMVPRSPDGRFGDAQAPGEDGQINNVLVTSNNWNGNNERTKLFSKFFTHIDLLNNLTMESSFSIDFDNRAVRRSGKLVDRWDFLDDSISRQATGPISASNRHDRNYQYVIDHLLRYSNSFADVHNLGLLAGYNANYSKEEWFSGSIRDLIDETTPVLGAGADNPQVDGNAADRSLQSFFGRVNYNYDERYLFEANLRHDGSSRFAEGRRWGTFPSFSAGWRLSEEEFMSDFHSIDNLTIRGSWGQLGNNRIGDYEFQSVYNSRNYSFGGNVAPGAAPGAIANPIITWEKTEMLNLGMLINAFNNRLTFEFDWFTRETRDILVNLPIPGVMGGLTAPRQNVGVVQNNGIDLQLGWVNNIGGDFSYGIDGNLGYVKNEVLTFHGDNAAFSNQNILLEGHPIWTYYVREVKMLVRTQEDLNWVEEQLAEGKSFHPRTPGMGDFVYKDNNNDGIYGNDDDRVITGKSNNPTLTFGISGFVNWKGFDFSMLWQGAANVHAYYNDLSHRTNVRNGYLFNADVIKNRWTPENPDATYPRLLFENDNQNSVVSDFWLRDASYIKLKNLQIGYTIPYNLMSRLGIQNRFRVYASGENLLTITDWPGLDPETARMGSNQTSYPTMRQVLFGVNITF